LSTGPNSSPAGVAALEIIIGARSDPHLIRKLKPLFAQIEREQFALSSSVFSGPKPPSKISVRTFYWAVYGLTIARFVVEDPNDAVKCVEFLKGVFLTYNEIERRKGETTAS
jgi:hypothetical protein